MPYKPEFVPAFQNCKEIENRLVTFRVIEFKTRQFKIGGSTPERVQPRITIYIVSIIGTFFFRFNSPLIYAYTWIN